jgi:hypothetical protein
MPGRDQLLKARTGTEKQGLKARAGRSLQPAPVFDRDQHSRLNPAPRDHLRPALESGFQKLTESGFCILHLPCRQAPPPGYMVTI